jgi:hypothetical protein
MLTTEAPPDDSARLCRDLYGACHAYAGRPATIAMDEAFTDTWDVSPDPKVKAVPFLHFRFPIISIVLEPTSQVKPGSVFQKMLER